MNNENFAFSGSVIEFDAEQIKKILAISIIAAVLISGTAAFANIPFQDVSGHLAEIFEGRLK